MPLFKESFSIYETEIGISSSLDLELERVFKAKFGPHVLHRDFVASELDGLIYVIDEEILPPRFQWSDRVLFCLGDFSGIRRMEGTRHSLAPYVLHVFVLTLLERKKHIRSCHASALFNDDTKDLLMFAGGVGAGKTSLLLSGLEQGWRIVGNDLVLFDLDQGTQPRFWVSSSECPVKMMTIQVFSEFLRQNGYGDQLDPIEESIKTGRVFTSATPLRLDKFLYPSVSIIPRRIFIFFPYVILGGEAGLKAVEDNTVGREYLYGYMTEKLRADSLMNYKYAVPSFDDGELMKDRVRFIETFLSNVTGLYFCFGDAKIIFSKIAKEICL
jgi:hypothetical protein